MQHVPVHGQGHNTQKSHCCQDLSWLVSASAVPLSLTFDSGNPKRRSDACLRPALVGMSAGREQMVHSVLTAPKQAVQPVPQALLAETKRCRGALSLLV